MAVARMFRRLVSAGLKLRFGLPIAKEAKQQLNARKLRQRSEHVVRGVQDKVRKAAGLNVHQRATLNKNKYQEGKYTGPKKKRVYVPGVADKRREIAQAIRKHRKSRP